MAFYGKDFYEKTRFLDASDSPHFERVQAPSASVDCPGIYRCENCGYEVVREHLQFLPHEALCVGHNFGYWKPAIPDAHVRWRLVVALRNKKPKP